MNYEQNVSPDEVAQVVQRPTAWQELMELARGAGQNSDPTPDALKAQPVLRNTEAPLADVGHLLLQQQTPQPTKPDLIAEARIRYTEQLRIGKLMDEMRRPHDAPPQPTPPQPQNTEPLKVAVPLEAQTPVPTRPVGVPSLQIQGAEGVRLVQQAQQAYAAAAEASRRRNQHAELYRKLAYAGRQTLTELRQQGQFYLNETMAQQAVAEALRRDEYYYQMYKNLGDMALKASVSEYARQATRAEAAYQAGNIVSSMLLQQGAIVARAENFWSFQGHATVTRTEHNKGRPEYAA